MNDLESIIFLTNKINSCKKMAFLRFGDGDFQMMFKEQIGTMVGHSNQNYVTEEIHKEGKVFLSSTNIDDEICLRIAILSFRTHIYEIELALNEIKTKLESIIKMH